MRIDRSRAGRGVAFLNEADSLTLLGAYGLPVVSHVLCRSADDARRAFSSFGGAVAVKACSTEVPHKSDCGLVVLDVGSADAAAEAFAQLTARIGEIGVACDGIIVSPMMRGRRELALGGRVDPVFGPIVMVSDGGRYVEAMPDLALILAPFDDEAARAAWQSLRIAPLFDGVRGEPALDLPALCASPSGLARSWPPAPVSWRRWT